MSENSYFAIGQEMVNLLSDIYRSRLPVDDLVVELRDGFLNLAVRVPMFRGKLVARLYPAGVSWGQDKELSFRFEEDGSLSLIKTAVRFIKRGVREENDLLFVDITQFWEKLPAEMRWNTKIERVEVREREVRVHLEKA